MKVKLMFDKKKKSTSKNSPVKIIKNILIFFLIFILLLIISTYAFFKYQKNKWTDTNAVLPKQETAANLSEREGEKLYKDIKNILSSDFSHQRSYSDKEFRYLLNYIPAYAEQSEKLSLKLQDEFILANCAVPLNNVPGMQGRYLNGEFVLKAEVNNGTVSVNVVSGKVKGKKVPDKLLKYINDNLAKELADELRYNSDLKKIEKLQVQDGKIHLKTAK